MDDVATMNASSLALSGELTRATVGARREEILSRFAGGGDVTLELAAVTSIDAAGVQLLVATRKWAEGRLRGFSLVGAPPAVEERLAALGASGALRGS
jgi:anti-anti-sigma regulatory factor